MPIKVEDRPSICMASCDFPDCQTREQTEAYPEAEYIQKTPNDWWIASIGKIESRTKFSEMSLPAVTMVFCPVHGRALFGYKEK